MYKNVQVNREKSQKLTQHSCCSMLTLEKIWKQEEPTDIVSSTKVKRSLPKPSGFLWEALVCEKLIPKPAPNGTIFLPQHVDAVPWYHAKFHEFQTSFRFTRILKPCISMLAAERQCQGVWHSFSFLTCDLSLQPRTNIWFFNPFLCTGACACSSILNYAHKCLENSVNV
jgi:hypothetical protein